MRIEVPQIDPTLWLRFTLEAKHRGTDVSALLSDALRLYLGMSQPVPPRAPASYLRRLAGTWSKEDAEEFERNIEWTQQIDADMWE